MSIHGRTLFAISMAAALPLAACKVYDPLYCDKQMECRDPDRPFCDLNGEFPDSEGVPRTCIADPNPESDAGPADAGPGNDSGGSSSDAATERRIVQVAVGSSHTCAVLSDGGLRCWGIGIALGYSEAEDVGDNEHPYQAGDVPTGGGVKQVGAGLGFTCALYEQGNVRCWGRNSLGQLGYGHTDDVSGVGNTPDLLSDVDLGGTASQITVGGTHACALLESGEVRCWGTNAQYELATGDQEAIGDDEVPGARSPIALGTKAIFLSATWYHTCAIIEGGFVRCWGTAFEGQPGPLGYGGIEPIGDDETPAQAGNINVGGGAERIAAGRGHGCVQLSKGRVRCWGIGGRSFATLGYQEAEDIGDDETPASVGDIDLGGEAAEISAVGTARCARLTSGSVRCWGPGRTAGGPALGSLGYGNDETIGDDETPAQAGDVAIGGSAVQLSSSGAFGHVCALLQGGALRCWGTNSRGELGLGHTDTIGDDEKPVDVDPVRVLE